MAVKGAFSWWVACRRYFVFVSLISWSFSLSFPISYTRCWSSLFAQAISSVLSRIFISRLILYSFSSSVTFRCVSMKWNIILLAAELIILTEGSLCVARYLKTFSWPVTSRIRSSSGSFRTDTISVHKQVFMPCFLENAIPSVSGLTSHTYLMLMPGIFIRSSSRALPPLPAPTIAILAVDTNPPGLFPGFYNFGNFSKQFFRLDGFFDEFLYWKVETRL